MAEFLNEYEQKEELSKGIGIQLGVLPLLVLRLYVTCKLKRLLNVINRNEKVNVMETCFHLH
jgi:hypothetical protein